MQLPQATTLIIDFDSTFITTEGLEELALISLADNPRKTAIITEITALTDNAMEGKISFKQSLEQRLKLLTITREHIEQTVTKLQVSQSIEKNKHFFQENNEHIFIISSGFKELILPIVAPFGIASDHVFANTFELDDQGKVLGCDTTNPLSQDNGKVTQIHKLHLSGNVYMIGDGFTDYQVKQAGLATTFVAFTENVSRDSVITHADMVVSSFDDFLFHIL